EAGSEAPGEGGRAVDRAARVEEILGAPLPYAHRQQYRGRRRDDAEADLGLAEARLRRDEEQAPGSGELEPAAQALAPGADEDRLGPFQHPAKQAVEAGEHLGAALGKVLLDT